MSEMYWENDISDDDLIQACAAAEWEHFEGEEKQYNSLPNDDDSDATNMDDEEEEEDEDEETKNIQEVPLVTDLVKLERKVLWREYHYYNREICHSQPTWSLEWDVMMEDFRYIQEESPILKEHFKAIEHEQKYLQAWMETSTE